MEVERKRERGRDSSVDYSTTFSGYLNSERARGACLQVNPIQITQVGH